MHSSTSCLHRLDGIVGPEDLNGSIVKAALGCGRRSTEQRGTGSLTCPDPDHNLMISAKFPQRSPVGLACGAGSEGVCGRSVYYDSGPPPVRRRPAIL